MPKSLPIGANTSFRAAVKSESESDDFIKNIFLLNIRLRAALRPETLERAVPDRGPSPAAQRASHGTLGGSVGWASPHNAGTRSSLLQSALLLSDPTPQ